MVIITKDAWGTKTEGEDVESTLPTAEYFGLQDLASDYFQVLRAASRPRVCRLLWSVLTLGLLSLTVFMVYKLLTDYFQYNSFNKISVKWQNSLELPAFTICSTNSINYTRLKEDFEEHAPELLEVINSYLIKMELYKGESNIEEYFDETEFKAFFEFDNGSFSLKDAYGNLVYDLILSDWYMVGGKKKIFDYFNGSAFLEYTELGQCLKFNDDKSMVQKTRGSGGGFSIDLFANVNTYMMTTRTRGFIIFLRDHGETVLLNQGGYVIEPGTETFLRLQKRSVTRLGKPHGTCLNIRSNLTKMEHFRSIRECVQDNSLEAMLRGCACMPSYYANTRFKLGRFDILNANVKIIKEAKKNVSYFNSTVKRRKREGGSADTSSNGSEDKISDKDGENVTPTPEYEDQSIYGTDYQQYVCTFSQETMCNFKREEHQNEFGKSYQCHEPCSFNEWDASVGVTSFPPSEKYFDKFLKDLYYDDINFTYPIARDNLARLHIYYDDIKTTEVVQEKTYEIQNFIAEFGGTVDLFIGFSFFTVFQLVEIGVAWCFWKIMKRNKSIRRESLPSYNGEGKDIVVYNMNNV